MFSTAPIFVCKRTRHIRALLFLLVFPASLLCLGITYISIQDHEWTVVAISAALGLCLGYLCWAQFRREQGRQVRLYEDGIELVGAQTAEFHWDQVAEIWLFPLKVRLLGTSGKYVAMTYYDKGIWKAIEIASAHVNPRLIESAKERVQKGETVAFGKFAISSRGIAYGGPEPTPFSEIESLYVMNDSLRLKKKGSLLDAIAVPLRKIPNAFVLTELYVKLANGPADREAPQTGRNVTSRMMV